MTAQERTRKTLRFEPTDRIPFAPHWWGMYKFELSDIAHDFSEEHKTWQYGGKSLADVDDLFFNTFQPDIMHLSGGCRKNPLPPEWMLEREKLCQQLRKFQSFLDIDELVSFVCFDEPEIYHSGIYDHVEIHRKNHPDTFIALNEGNPIGSVIDPHGYAGFEEGMIALLEHPDKMEYLLFSLYDKMIPQMRALKNKKADAYIGSETVCSADLISPAIYRSIIFPAQKHFYTQIKKFGLTPIAYFTGEIMPLLEDISNMGIDALMVEEPKKNYRINIAEISHVLEGKVAVFGNIDSVHDLLLGTPQQVYAATLTQLQSIHTPGFFAGCGSPIAFHTPKENLFAMRQAVYDYNL